MKYTLILDFYGNIQEIEIEANTNTKEMMCNNFTKYFLNNNNIKSFTFVDANKNIILQMIRKE